jgi:hypothetical protein
VGVTKDEIISRLRSMNRKEVHRKTGIPYGYLSKLVYGEIEDPGHTKIDTLRAFLISEEVRRGRQ